MPPRPDGVSLTQRERLRIQHQTEDEAVVRGYRLLHLVAAVLVPVFWYAYRKVEPNTFDPLAARIVLSGISVVILGLSYVSALVRRYLVFLSHGVVYLLTLWILVLTVINGFPANYAIGYYFLVSVGGIAIGLSVRTVWPLVVFYASTLIVTTTAMLMMDARPEVDEAVFFFSLLGSALVIVIALRSRAQAHEALRSSEAHLSEAQRIARLGNWELDTVTGRTWWSEEAAFLLGWSDTDRTWETFLDLLEPEDSESAAAWRAQDGADAFPRYLHLARPAGAARVLEAKVEVLPDDTGAPRYVLGTCLDVTEQQDREAELLAAKDKAEEMNRLKDAFLANMSHEIRTPLTAVIGYAEVLAQEVGPDFADLAEPIASGGRRLLETLNSVLELAQLEAGGQRLSIQPVSVKEVVDETVQLLVPGAERRGLSVQVQAAPCWALADRAALARILHNLVGNAIKFTERGYVRVHVSTREDTVLIAVTDSGIGIAPAFLPYLFDEFKQESTGFGRSHEGSGLGLTLTKRLVELMAGTITVQSRPGEGSTFTVALPLAVAQQARFVGGTPDSPVLTPHPAGTH